MKLIFLDTETTGLKTPHVVEFAYGIQESQGMPFAITHHKVKPPVEIEEGATAIHGITNDMVKDWKSFQDQSIHGYLSDHLVEGILVAHNAKFDIRVLALAGIEVSRFIDTQKVAKYMFPNLASYSLQNLRADLQLDVDPEAAPHSSMGDVIVLDALFRKIVHAYMDQFQGSDYDIMIEEFISNSR